MLTRVGGGVYTALSSVGYVDAAIISCRVCHDLLSRADCASLGALDPSHHRASVSAVCFFERSGLFTPSDAFLLTTAEMSLLTDSV